MSLWYLLASRWTFACLFLSSYFFCVCVWFGALTICARGCSDGRYDDDDGLDDGGDDDLNDDLNNDDDERDRSPKKKRTLQSLPTDAKWVHYQGAPECRYAKWLCATCGIRIADRAAQSGEQVVHPIVPLDKSRPHVWSLCQTDGWIVNFLYADSLADDDFVVPAAATHMLDPHVLPGLVRCVQEEPTVHVVDICTSEMGSVRGWMPLVGSHVVHATGGSWHVIPERTRVPMVCCDRKNPLWGAVVLVDFHRNRTTMTWHGIDHSLADLLGRWRRALCGPSRAENWAEWTGRVYVNAVERARDITHQTLDIAERAEFQIRLEEYVAGLPHDHPDRRFMVRRGDDPVVVPLQYRVTAVRRCDGGDGDDAHDNVG